MRGASAPTVGRWTGGGANGLSIGPSSSSPGVRNGLAGRPVANGLAAGAFAWRSARNGFAGGGFGASAFALDAVGSSYDSRAAFEPRASSSQ